MGGLMPIGMLLLVAMPFIVLSVVCSSIIPMVLLAVFMLMMGD